MDLDAALEVLGLGRDTTWAEIRAEYRTRIRAVHPDVAAGSTTHAAVRLNAAFAMLEPVYRRGRPEAASLPPPPPPPNDVWARSTVEVIDGDDGDAVLVDDDGLALIAPADEVFLRLATALDEVGDLTYTDQESGYLEALIADGAGQLVVSLQGRAHATEAFFTLEPMDTRPVPPIDTVVRELARRLRVAR